MPVFHYRAIDQSGEVVTGILDCPDRAAAASRLQASGHLPVRIEAKPERGLMALLNTEITPRDALAARDRMAFTRALATLTGAGLPLDRALEIAAELGERSSVRAVSGRLLDTVREGSSFADALDRESTGFPPLYRAVIRAGEAGAALETTLARLADTLEAQAKQAGELRSALIYPAFLIVTAIGSVALLLGYVVPSFEPLLDAADVDPPPITAVVIAAGRFVETWWAVMLAALVGLLAAGRIALLWPAIRLAWHRALLDVPLLGSVWKKAETARLTRLLASLLENGLALPTALRHAQAALANRAVAAEIARVIPEVEAGRGLSLPLQEGAVLPPLARQLIRVGEESGQLTEMLARTAGIFEEESRRAVAQALSILTPALTLLMGVLIAVIISSILFALFTINELAI
ncbi:MAG: type II secretion system F family protein [Pikeienuella sp.]